MWFSDSIRESVKIRKNPFSQREFDEKVCPITFVQDNESKSSYGVM